MDSSLQELQDNNLCVVDSKIKSLEKSIEALKLLKIHRNTLVPISRLTSEILVSIFSLLSSSVFSISSQPFAAPFIFSHVCHKWREISLNFPHLWSRINFTQLTLASTAKMLTRAKTVPLHLEADLTGWGREQIDAFERLLNGHISQTRDLRISGPLPAFGQLVSSAPILESLSLSHTAARPDLSYPAIIPPKLFNSTTPRLTSVELKNCYISWKSRLFKSLRILKILNTSEEERPSLEVWLNTLGEMTQLETLVLESATPRALHTSDSWRIITLPSLTKFHISASAADCALALAHLVMPALTSLHVNAKSQDDNGEDVRPLIRHISQNVYVLQSTEPLRSILIDSKRNHAEVLAWTMSGADLKFRDPNVKDHVSVPPSLIFTATGIWSFRVNNAILEAFLTLLPVNTISTLTTRNDASLSKKFWVSHTPRWPLLKRASLVARTFSAFMSALTDDAPPDGPRLPWLTKLNLVYVTVDASMTRYLRAMLIQRVEQGVPLERLDLSMSFVDDGDIHLLREIVVDVKEPMRN